MDREAVEMVRKFKTKLKEDKTSFSQFAFTHELWECAPPSSLYAQLDVRRSMTMHPEFRKAILEYLNNAI